MGEDKSEVKEMTRGIEEQDRKGDERREMKNIRRMAGRDQRRKDNTVAKKNEGKKRQDKTWTGQR